MANYNFYKANYKLFYYYTKKLLVLGLISGVVLAGCAPAHIARLQTPEESQRAEVLVYRESALNAVGAGMIFGANKSDYVTLGNKQYTNIYVPPGKYDFFVRTNTADRPYTLPVSIAANERKCLKAYANPTNYAKSALPFTYLMGSTFLLDSTSCPTNEELEKYSKVEIEYQNN